MFETIQCHKDFFSGSRDSQFHVDIPKLTADEYARLEAFIDFVLDAEDLSGRNKPSYTDENGKPIYSAILYSHTNAWHYHSGPYSRIHGTVKTPPHLPENLKGASSAEIVHYIKDESNKTIILIGYSREHIPFPKSDSRSNPLRTRLGNWVKKVVPLENSSDGEEALP